MWVHLKLYYLHVTWLSVFRVCFGGWEFASLFATFGFCLPLLDFKYLVVVSNVKMKLMKINTRAESAVVKMKKRTRKSPTLKIILPYRHVDVCIQCFIVDN